MAVAGSFIQNKIDASIQHLSSGQRINVAIDDVAGGQISTHLNAEIKGLEQAQEMLLMHSLFWIPQGQPYKTKPPYFGILKRFQFGLL